jgi:hypothetical protein
MNALVSADRLPGPRGLPFLGNALQLGSKPVVVISDLDLIMQILKECPDLFRRFSAIETVFEGRGTPSLFSM